MDWALPTIALVVLAYAAVSGRLDGTPVTAPMVFTAAGLLVGVDVLGIVELNTSGETVKLLAEATLAVVLFGDAARIDLRALRGEYGIPARLLGIGLPLTILAGLGLALIVFGSLSWPEALVLAIVLAPTDAALGQSVVTLTAIPSRIRQALNVESGLNDGLCVPLFTFAVALASAEAGIIGDRRAVTLVAEAIGYGVLFGVLGGAAAAAVVRVSVRRGLVQPTWLQVVPVAGAVLAYTSADAAGGSGFVAAFVGGVVFGGIRRRVGGEVGYLVEELGALLGAATFVVFGATLLEPALGDVTPAVVVYAVLSLTVVRMVPVALALLGTGARRPTVGFVGWFGPRGLASIVFAVLIVEATGELPNEGVVLTTVFVTVGLSVLLHGLTAAPLARRYADWFAGHPRRESLAVESGEVPVAPWRASSGMMEA
ncbi:MAG TPA: cation:proton antiporter [Gaiellaceae bacterium]|nr:cation:proton antiporter [Gaiellaceae bacterium]